MNELDANSRALDRFVEQAARLYTLPGVALQVLDLTGREEIDTHALKQCIELDPALTGKILRVVNSPLFGLSRQVSDLNQALALLGTKPLKMLVLGFSLPDTLTANVRGDMLARYWWHALHKAVAARELSETYWHAAGDEAFIAGLLQDIGMLVLIQHIGDPYVKFLERILADGGDLIAAEIDSLGFSHFQLSSRLLEHWGLPPNLVKAVGCAASTWSHATYPATPAGTESATEWRGTMGVSGQLAEILQLADLAAVLLTQQQPAAARQIMSLVAESGRLTRDDLGRMLHDLQAKVEQLAEVMSLKLPHGGEYQAMIVRAQEQLAAATDDAFLEIVQRAAPAEDCEAETLALWGETLALTSALAKFMQGTGAGGNSQTGEKRKSKNRQHLPQEVFSQNTEPVRGMANETPSETAQIGRRRGTMAGRSPGSRCSPELLDRVGEAVSACRKSRTSLSLLFAEIDTFGEWTTAGGPFNAERLARSFQALCRRLDHSQLLCYTVSEGSVAVLLSDCDRSLAVQLGKQLMRAAQSLVPEHQLKDGPVAVSIGLATLEAPAKNFSPRDLITAAERCLHTAQSGGGNLLKSIGVY